MATYLTPALAWRRLREGNERFVNGESSHPNQDASRRSSLVENQHPFAVIFGCSDSRLAAEIIFDLGLGDAFVVRTAGQVIDDAVLGSLEYSIGVLAVPLIVVLAMTAAARSAPPKPPWKRARCRSGSSATSWSGSRRQS